MIIKLDLVFSQIGIFKMSKKSTPIPGLSFSWKRALGITKVMQTISRTTGVPMTKNGIERKIGNTIIKKLFGKKESRGNMMSDV